MRTKRTARTMHLVRGADDVGPFSSGGSFQPEP